MPHPVDVHVGTRLRFKRQLLGLSQTALGEPLGLSYQQIQKYERGANRMGASRLFQIASILDVPIMFFFEDMPSKITGPDKFPADAVVIDSQATKLIRAYVSVPDERVRKGIRDLVRQLATDPEHEGA